MDKLHENFEDFVNEGKQSFNIKKGKFVNIYDYIGDYDNMEEFASTTLPKLAKQSGISSTDITNIEEINNRVSGGFMGLTGFTVVEFKKGNNPKYFIQIEGDSPYTVLYKTNKMKDFTEADITKALQDEEEWYTNIFNLTKEQIEQIQEDDSDFFKM